MVNILENITREDTWRQQRQIGIKESMSIKWSFWNRKQVQILAGVTSDSTWAAFEVILLFLRIGLIAHVDRTRILHLYFTFMLVVQSGCE